jgi:hypothetical protein
MGKCRPIDVAMTNDRIKEVSGDSWFRDNEPVYKYLLSRRDKDLIAVHGLRHTHKVTSREITTANVYLRTDGFKPTYFVPPFNEDSDSFFPKNRSRFEDYYRLKFCGIEADRLETWMDNKTVPQTGIISGIIYCHSWRFCGSPYNLKQLEELFKILKNG